MYVSSLKYVCLIIVCFSLAFTEGAKLKGNAVQPRIIGGHVALENYPFVASILADTIFGSFHSCGGSIINERTVLTAAHCLFYTTDSKLKVHVGEKSRAVLEGEVYDVEKIYYHEKWNSVTQDYDVGLVRIVGSFTFGPLVQPIKLAGPRYRIRDGSYATVLGWGFTDVKEQTAADYLMVAHVPIVKQTTCNRQMGGLITKRMICAGFKSGGVDACQMDSGGPLVANNRLIGIVSWGVSCAQPNKPGVYARVSELLPWIENILFKNYNEIL
ncbi:trypsin 5G1-like [Lucilia sericata]|uniref:trypsin 5G1-like n=1 Tax=Lucilia sericata TaxID=13632 RepID=UPI0018A83138|nr:trypsin 5G1-like [Lucilia sericata]